MTNGIRAIRTLRQLRAQVAAWRAAGETIALVPTMGALHEGHLALVRLGRQRCRRVVVSIFVNPTQFAPHEDFERYPRDEAATSPSSPASAATRSGCRTAAAMYPDGFATRIVPAGAAAGLRATSRPHFFGGVATVCCKLFAQVAPDVAVFGEKDYQQLCVIRQMVRDLDLPLEIVGAPTVREADGLALSSRNAYLTPEQRRIAPELNRAITRVAAAVRTGAAPAEAAAQARDDIARAGFSPVDYVEVRDADTLAPATAGGGRSLRVLAAAWLGKTRLIDNVAV